MGRLVLENSSQQVYRCGAVNFDPYNILAGFIFGTLGFGAVTYGKKLELWQPVSYTHLTLPTNREV